MKHIVTFIFLFVFSLLSAQTSEIHGHLNINGKAGEFRMTNFYIDSKLIAEVSARSNDAYFIAWDDDLFLRAADDVFMQANVITIDPNSGDDAILRSNPDDSGGDLFLESNDAVVIRIDNNNNGSGNFFVWDDDGTNLFQVKENGDVLVGGSLEHSSDRNRKEAIESIDYNHILSSVLDMPIYEWQYKEHTRRHIGPMAQDFHKAFGLGEDDKTIAAIDADGVALAAIKAQQKLINQQTILLELQMEQIKLLSKRVDVLEGPS